MKKNTLDNQVVATFTRQLGLVLDSDLPINSGLDVIKSKTNSTRMVEIIEAVQKEMKEGYSLTEGLNKFKDDFSPFVISMIGLGEKSGSLTLVLNQIADTLEKEIEIKAKIRAAMAYPVILSILMLGVIMLLVLKVLPIFSEILDSLGGEMPFFTELMIKVSEGISNNIFIILAVVALAIAAFYAYRNTEKGSYTLDKLKFTMPIQKGIVSAVMGTKFSRNLSLLLKSGFSFSIAMEMLKPIMNNQYMTTLLDEAIVRLKDGDSIADVIEDFNIFPGVMIKLFSVAQQTGHMDKMLDKVAEEMEKEADLKLDNVATVIEPFLIIVLSVLVGIILVSVILPIINILNSIG